MLTSEGKAVPVKWMGRQSILRLNDPMGRRTPVAIAAGALGGGLPLQELRVTADHALLIDGVLINAGALVNGSSIRTLTRAEMPARLVYHHVETEAHDVILANGVPAETFVDYDSRKSFDNYDEYVALFGDERQIAEMPRPRISSSRLVPAPILARIKRAAEEMRPELALSA